MKRTLARILLFLLAAAAGWGTTEVLYRTQSGRSLVARFLRSEGAIRLQANLRTAAEAEAISAAQIDHEVELLRSQFADDARFQQVLERSGISLGELRTEIAEHLRARAWIEKQIAEHTRVTDAEIRDFHASHRARFTQPPRYRASHLFVAAPTGSPPDVIAQKLKEIEGLSMRVIAGEKFTQLVAEASEDEASKTRGGDLGYFSEARMPQEFLDELKKLRAAETSGPIRSHLGFHLIQLTEVKPAADLSVEQARAEIALAIANRKRALAVASLTERLSAPEFQPR